MAGCHTYRHPQFFVCFVYLLILDRSIIWHVLRHDRDRSQLRLRRCFRRFLRFFVRQFEPHRSTLRLYIDPRASQLDSISKLGLLVVVYMRRRIQHHDLCHSTLTHTHTTSKSEVAMLNPAPHKYIFIDHQHTISAQTFVSLLD